MFSWSRGEVGLALIISGLIVVGGVGHLWLSYQRLQGASVVVEAAAVEDMSVEASATEAPEKAAIGLPAAIGMDCDEDMVPVESPPVGEASPSSLTAVASAPSSVDHRININIAQPSELQRLPGIGPALATRIVAYREAWGPFSVVEDILEVAGIGPRKFEDIKHLIKVD